MPTAVRGEGTWEAGKRGLVVGAQPCMTLESGVARGPLHVGTPCVEMPGACTIARGAPVGQIPQQPNSAGDYKDQLWRVPLSLPPPPPSGKDWLRCVAIAAPCEPASWLGPANAQPSPEGSCVSFWLRATRTRRIPNPRTHPPLPLPLPLGTMQCHSRRQLRSLPPSLPPPLGCRPLKEAAQQFWFFHAPRPAPDICALFSHCGANVQETGYLRD